MSVFYGLQVGRVQEGAGIEGNVVGFPCAVVCNGQGTVACEGF